MKSLIVDDEMMSRMMLSIIIGQFGACVQAASGEEAVVSFREALECGAPYDLVSLDLDMPGINGLEALRQMREVVRDRGGSQPFRVFIMTGDQRDDLEQGVLEGTFDRYFVKPYNRERILQALAECGLA
jgi:two-component system, chemotaxis family, chemotaxis protein CheY